jgi:hypothetical protein
MHKTGLSRGETGEKMQESAPFVNVITTEKP